jgi:hypothetical protein
MLNNLYFKTTNSKEHKIGGIGIILYGDNKSVSTEVKGIHEKEEKRERLPARPPQPPAGRKSWSCSISCSNSQSSEEGL